MERPLVAHPPTIATTTSGEGKKLNLKEQTLRNQEITLQVQGSKPDQALSKLRVSTSFNLYSPHVAEVARRGHHRVSFLVQSRQDSPSLVGAVKRTQTVRVYSEEKT
jgi:hypothetical protein